MGNKEAKSSSYANDVLVFIENPKDFTQNYKINEFSKAAGCKINIKKLVAFSFFGLVFYLSRAAPEAHGGSQGLIGAIAPTPQLTEMLDP